MWSISSWDCKQNCQVPQNENEVKLDGCKSQTPIFFSGRWHTKVLLTLLGFKDLIWSSTIIWWILWIAWTPRKKDLKLIFLLNWWVAKMERRQRGWSLNNICSLGMENFISPNIRLRSSFILFYFSSEGVKCRIEYAF